MALSLYHRLEGKQQPVVAQSLLDLLADCHGRAEVVALSFREAIDRHTVSTCGLGRQKGTLALRHHIDGCLRVLGEDNHSGGYSDMNRAGLSLEGTLTHGLQDALSCRLGFTRRTGRQDHAETITAQPADHVGGAKTAVQPPADLDQHLVADLIAVGRVDLIESVDADHDESPRPLEAQGIG